MIGQRTEDFLKQPICPECSTEYVTRVRREAIGERLVSLFYVYPFRCQLCGYRFSSVQWGVRYFRVYEDHREYERIPVNFPVAFTSGGVDGQGWVSDISMGGCTICSEAQLSYAQIVKISLQIPNDDLPVAVSAAVVRNMQLNRIGLEFLRLQQVERNACSSLFETNCSVADCAVNQSRTFQR
jgi:PilZ domain